jgi:hypothetical protein
MTVTERTERGPGRQARDRATVGTGTREEFASCDPATGDLDARVGARNCAHSR